MSVFSETGYLAVPPTVRQSRSDASTNSFDPAKDAYIDASTPTNDCTAGSSLIPQKRPAPSRNCYGQRKQQLSIEHTYSPVNAPQRHENLPPSTRHISPDPGVGIEAGRNPNGCPLPSILHPSWLPTGTTATSRSVAPTTMRSYESEASELLGPPIDYHPVRTSS